MSTSQKDDPSSGGGALSLLYKIFVLSVLFGGGYVLMRYGLEVDEDRAFWIACVGMPCVTFLLWLVEYRGKRFK